MSTPTLPRKNSFRRLGFFTLAGVSKAELNLGGRQIVVVQKNPLPAFRVEDGSFICAEFVNWPSDAAGVLRFTLRYGALTAPIKSGEQFSFSVVDWKKYQQMVRDYWEMAKCCHAQLGFRDHGMGGLECIPAAADEEFHCLAEKLEYRTASLFRFILMEFHSIPFERLRMCKAPRCSTPYFVATHLSQRYCGAMCAGSVQSQWKKNWWDKSGKQWRNRRAKEKRLTKAQRGKGGT